MPLLEVACPGCQAVLKAPDTMAGKKARCKRCNTPFRLPGGAGVDSVGDSQQLSVVDPPPAAKRPAPPPPPAEDDIPSATAVDEEEPLSASVAEDDPLPAVVAEEPPADPFAFSSTPAKKARQSRQEEPPAPPPADPFAFSSAPEKKARKAREEEEPPEPAPAADAGDPFSFNPSAAPEPKKARKPRDEDDEPDRPAARKKPAGGGGIIKVAVAAAVFAMVAGGIVAGVLIYLANTKSGEQAKNEKKDEKKLDPPPNDPAPPPAPAGGTEPTTKGKDAGKGVKGTTPPVKGTKGPKTGGGAMLVLAPGKAMTFPPKPAAPKGVTEPASNPVPLAVPFAELRRFFAPGKAEGDIGVAWRSATGFQGAGEKITLSLFSPSSGTETGKVEVDSDGQPEPACDLSADGGTFAYGNRTTGKVVVWDVRKKTKKLDAFDPYADKPEHKSAKLAAVYLTEPPTLVVTVTTAGAVHAWDVATKAETGEFIPPKGTPGKVSAGRSAAAMTNRQGVVVAVGGAVHAVTAVGGVSGTQVADLGGDVGRSMGLAVSPLGRVVYAFETDADGKKEKAVAHLSEGKVGPVLRWPADAGEPVAAGWVGDAVASVATSQGSAVWFDADGGGFNVLGVARTPEDKAAHGSGEYHWALLPAAGDAKRCVAVSIPLPPPGVGDPLTPAARRPVASLVLDLKGLSQ